jgi:excisionase family DNA binding protein
MGNKLMQNEDIPLLDGWVTLPEAAQRLGISRQYAYKLASDGYFRSLRRLGESVLVVGTWDVIDKQNERKKGLTHVN